MHIPNTYVTEGTTLPLDAGTALFYADALESGCELEPGHPFEDKRPEVIAALRAYAAEQDSPPPSAE